MRKIYSLIAIIMAVLLTFGSVGVVLAAEDRELTNDEKAAFIVRDEWSEWVKNFTASLSELDKNATATIYEDMDFYDMQYRFTEKYKKVPEYLDENGKPTQKLKDMIKEKRKEINRRKAGYSKKSDGTIDWSGVMLTKWMKELPDDRYLNDINIPGTANSGLAISESQAGDDIRIKTAVCRQTQIMYSQLSNGYRAFDLGVLYDDDADVQQVVLGGLCDSKEKLSVYPLSEPLKGAFEHAISFLNSNDKETVVFILRNVGNDSDIQILNQSITELIRSGKAWNDQYNIKDYVYTGNTIPKLKDVRKKIVLLSAIPGLEVGIDLQPADYLGTLFSGRVIDGVSFFVENHEHHLTADEKVSYVSDAFDTVTRKTLSIDGTKGKNGSIIYTSGYKYDDTDPQALKYVLPKTVATAVNSSILSYDFTQGNLVGIVLMDNANNDNLARKIFVTNP